MDEFEVNDLIDKEYEPDKEIVSNNQINKIINDLKMYNDNIEMLTKTYTDALEDDNIVYIMTKISQNLIFMTHFPEFYNKNEKSIKIMHIFSELCTLDLLIQKNVVYLQCQKQTIPLWPILNLQTNFQMKPLL